MIFARVFKAFCTVGCVATVFATSQATAQSTDILGAWVIEASMSSGNGVMFILGKEGNTYTCEFSLGNSEQSCKIIRTGDRLVIRSTIVRASSDYAPDNFSLKIVGPDRMEGDLISHSKHSVVFTRQ